MDPRTVITESGYIKSRFLDDKLSAAILLGLAKAVKDAIILVYENFLQIMLFRSLFLKALHPRNANFWISFKCQRISLLYLP